MKFIKKTKKERLTNKIRSIISGTAKRPRITVFRSNKSIYAQLIDDTLGRTLACASDKDIKKGTKKVERSFIVGKTLGDTAKKLGIKSAVFDRSGYHYHGRIKSLADGARSGGLKF